MLDAVNEVRTKPRHLADTLDELDAPSQLLEEQVDFHPRKICAEAVMLAAAAERDVLVGRARDVELEGIVEDLLVAIGRNVPDSDLVARLELLAAQLGV